MLSHHVSTWLVQPTQVEEADDDLQLEGGAFVVFL